MNALTKILFSATHLRARPEAPNPNSLYVGKPVAYHVTRDVQVCRQCRSYHTSHQVMLEVLGPRFKIFRRIGKFEFNLPIITHEHEAEEILACCECAPSLSLSHLPPPPTTPNPTPSAVKAAWREKAQLETKKPKSLLEML